jgi:acetylglutamate kinase
VSAAPAPVVVKLGGRALAVPGALDGLATELAALAGRAVVVHGGGAEVTAWSARLGLPAGFHEGRRVTDEATLEVATAVLAGLANKRLVAALRARGVDAVGLAALDGGIVRVVRHAEPALGAVGTVTGVDPALLLTLLASGRTPVIASIGAADGALLNLNADDVAAALAPALGAAALVLLSDTPGLVLGGKVVRTLDRAALEQALAGGEVTGGMQPKLQAAAAAVDGGTASAWIAEWTGPGTLTRLLAGEEGPYGTRIIPARPGGGTDAATKEETAHGR